MSKGLIDFKEKGYVNFGSILSSEDASKLAVLCRQIYETIDKDAPSYFTGGVDGFNQLIIHDPNTATLINKIFCNSNIKFFLEQVLGQKYKILDIGFRRSKPGDRGLYLHQMVLGRLIWRFVLMIIPMEMAQQLFYLALICLKKVQKNYV